MWKDDKPHGLGYFIGDDFEYCGEFQDGKVQGPGNLAVSEREHIISGNFNGDFLSESIDIKQAVFRKAPGNRYER